MMCVKWLTRQEEHLFLLSNAVDNVAVNSCFVFGVRMFEDGINRHKRQKFRMGTESMSLINDYLEETAVFDSSKWIKISFPFHVFALVTPYQTASLFLLRF